MGFRKAEFVAKTQFLYIFHISNLIINSKNGILNYWMRGRRRGRGVKDPVTTECFEPRGLILLLYFTPGVVLSLYFFLFPRIQILNFSFSFLVSLFVYPPFL